MSIPTIEIIEGDRYETERWRDIFFITLASSLVLFSILLVW